MSVPSGSMSSASSKTEKRSRRLLLGKWAHREDVLRRVCAAVDTRDRTKRFLRLEVHVLEALEVDRPGKPSLRSSSFNASSFLPSSGVRFVPPP